MKEIWYFENKEGDYLLIDIKRARVQLNGKSVYLGMREYACLLRVAAHPEGSTIEEIRDSADLLARQHVWVSMHRLKRKLQNKFVNMIRPNGMRQHGLYFLGGKEWVS